MNRLVFEQLCKDTKQVIVARCPPATSSETSPPGDWFDPIFGVKLESDLPVHASWQPANYDPKSVTTMPVQQVTERAQARQLFAFALAVLLYSSP